MGGANRLSPAFGMVVVKPVVFVRKSRVLQQLFEPFLFLIIAQASREIEETARRRAVERYLADRLLIWPKVQNLRVRTACGVTAASIRIEISHVYVGREDAKAGKQSQQRTVADP